MSAQFHMSKYDYSSGIAVDDNSNIYITGGMVDGVDRRGYDNFDINIFKSC